MRSLVVSITAAVALLIGIFTAAPALASHSAAIGAVQVRHGSNTNVATYEIGVACTGTSCSVTVQVSKMRDYNRYLRWCEGDTSVSLTVLANDTSSNNVFCQGPSTWSIRVFAFLSTNIAGTDITTHPSDVAVTVNVTGP
jgi:hypothetical protein